MPVAQTTDYDFPPLPLAAWEDTKETLHLFLQIVGKIRLRQHPKLNHWWHVTLYPSARGLTTGRIPYGGREFDLEFDFIDHVLRIRTSTGDIRQFALEGLSVADFYRQVFDELRSLNIEVPIYAHPYMTQSQIPFAEDTEHRSYDREAVSRYWTVLRQLGSIFEEFRGRFIGKSTPVQLYWHSFDLVVTRFSGRPAPPRTTGTPVDKEAYSHEVISFGFWPGDANFREAAFYSYTYPAPEGLAETALQPKTASWQQVNNSPMAILKYEDMRTAPNPKAALLDFLESAYQAGARLANWPVADFTAAWCQDSKSGRS